MVEPTIKAVASIALECSHELYQKIKDIQEHPSSVRDLNNELEALNGILKETVKVTTDTDLSMLRRLLQRCGNACNEFKLEFEKNFSEFDDNLKVFRGWAYLKYGGGDIEGFRRILTLYKSTILITLINASFRNCYIDVESIDEYRGMIKIATIDLRERLDIITTKLILKVEQMPIQRSSHDAERQQLVEDQLNIRECLGICAQLSTKLYETRFTQIPKESTQANLRNHIASCVLTNSEPEIHIKDIISRLKVTARLEYQQKDYRIAGQCIHICSLTGTNTIIVKNFSFGDNSVQVSVLSEGKGACGQNLGFGSRTVQVSGYFDPESLRHILQDIDTRYNDTKEI